MKAYLVYQNTNWSGYIHAMLIREDGHCLADHICSKPVFMFGDLWNRRPNMKKEFPDLEVINEPMSAEQLKEKYPDVFALTFVETK